MASCNSGKCKIDCEKGCGCISDAKTGECLGCICDEDGIIRKPKKVELGSGSMVHFHARNLRLVLAAKLINRFAPGRFAVPAANLSSRISLDLVNKPVGKIAQAASLVTM